MEPRNILADNPHYEISVVDFSLSRISGAQLKTNPGYIESFASPEQELGLVPLLPESDLYSLGAVMVYLLNGGNIDQVKKRLVPSETQEPLKTFLQSLLQYEIQDRSKDAKALFQEMNGIRQKLFGLTNDITNGIRSA